MWNQARVAVVVPAYREAQLIARTLGGIPSFVDSVFVVDDDSPDLTLHIARSHPDPRIHCLSHPTNRGVGAAIVTGYRAALAAGHDVLAVMAADDQMHPDDLGAVVDPVASGAADYVKGNRWLHPQARRIPKLRRWGGAWLSALTRLATGLGVGDAQCGYTALSARAARRLELGSLWPRFGYPNDLLLRLARQGMRVVEVPVRPVYANEESGVRPWHLFSISALIAWRWWQSQRTAIRSAERWLASR